MLKDYQAEILKNYHEEHWTEFVEWLSALGYQDADEVAEKICDDLEEIAQK